MSKVPCRSTLQVLNCLILRLLIRRTLLYKLLCSDNDIQLARKKIIAYSRIMIMISSYVYNIKCLVLPSACLNVRNRIYIKEGI